MGLLHGYKSSVTSEALGRIASMAAIKFADPNELPEGFLFRDGFLSEAEEAELLQIFRGLQFSAYDYHGYPAKRRVVR